MGELFIIVLASKLNHDANMAFIDDGYKITDMSQSFRNFLIHELKIVLRGFDELTLYDINPDWTPGTKVVY
jgi:hypothetical protein